MNKLETKFSIDEIVAWQRDTSNKMVITGIYIDKHQIQYHCRPVNQQFAASYFFEYDLVSAD